MENIITMSDRKIQCLGAALLAAAIFTAAGPAGEPVAEPSPTASPLAEITPSPTPRIIPVALHFRRPAKIIPVYREDGEAEIPLEDFEIADEDPWLTDEDIRWVRYHPADHPTFIRLYLTPEGTEKYGEARMGNIGRNIILVIDGTARTTTPMVPARAGERDQIAFPGEFSAPELEQLRVQITYRPPPTPAPAPSPTPARKDRFIIR